MTKTLYLIIKMLWIKTLWQTHIEYHKIGHPQFSWFIIICPIKVAMFGDISRFQAHPSIMWLLMYPSISPIKIPSNPYGSIMFVGYIMLISSYIPMFFPQKVLGDNLQAEKKTLLLEAFQEERRQPLGRTGLSFRTSVVDGHDDYPLVF